jgi:hypothetical protein
MAHDLKPFEIEVREAFERHNVGALIHATDRANLDSITANGGLYSWAGCEQRGIVISKPGGDDGSRRSDLRRGLEHFVRTSFNKNQPQVWVWRFLRGRFTSPVYLEIDPVVALWQSTLYSDENAIAGTASVGGDVEHFRALRLGVATAARWNGPTEKRYYQAEVMVRDFIPAELILNLGAM